MRKRAGRVDRFYGWLNRQATAGGDLRFWFVAGGWTLFLLLLCVAFALGLHFLFEGSLLPSGEEGR